MRPGSSCRTAQVESLRPKRRRRTERAVDSSKPSGKRRGSSAAPSAAPSAGAESRRPSSASAELRGVAAPRTISPVCRSASIDASTTPGARRARSKNARATGPCACAKRVALQKRIRSGAGKDTVRFEWWPPDRGALDASLATRGVRTGEASPGRGSTEMRRRDGTDLDIAERSPQVGEGIEVSGGAGGGGRAAGAVADCRLERLRNFRSAFRSSSRSAARSTDDAATA